MIRLLFGLFLILLPFLELLLLIETIDEIGLWYTLLIMVASALLGGFVMTQQSASAFRQALEATSRGQIPRDPVIDGLFLMVAGVLLMIPGLITDAMGLLLLVPPIRRWVARQAFAGVIWAKPRDDERGREDAPDPNGAGPFDRSSPPAGKGPVIEGEFERLDERPRRRDR
jgi:UPF0716 protein FxsA